MKYRYLCFFLLLALLGCSSFPEKYTPPAEARVSGDTLYYKGSIDAQCVLEAIRLAKSNATPITRLEINSGGGDIFAGMEFGLWVHQNNIVVVIDELCFSSCANYLLTAASKVQVKSGAFVGWHGGAYQKTWIVPKWYDYLIPNKIREERRYFEGYIEHLRIKETTFFKTIGVDQKITTYGQDESVACQAKTGSSGWFYRLSDLRYMGVKEVSIDDKAFNAKDSRGKLSACELPELFGARLQTLRE